WAFLDEDLRPTHPLLSNDAWVEALKSSGFAETSVETLAAGGGDVFGQAIVLARTSGTKARADKVTVVLEGERGLGGFLSDAGKIITGIAQAGGSLTQLEPGRWSLDATDERQVRAFLGAVQRSEGVIDTVVHLLGADLHDSTSQQEACASALYLVRALSGEKCRVVIATAGAVHALEGDACPGYGAATLWGFGKAAALEHPDLGLRLVDLDPYDNAAAAQALQSELAGDDGEQMSAWRAGRRYLARLRPVEPPRLRKAGIHGDGAYLITGAFGGLGLLTAEWLASQGAGELVLTGRREPDPPAANRLDRIRAAGTCVRVLRADVTCADEVARAVESCSLPLKGVLHLAGELSDGLIERIDWASFDRVLKPKVAGLMNLHAATLGHAIDFFVVFSSAVGQLGNVGQASHASASAMAEAFAWNRRAHGLPALTIDWGAWLEAGAAVDGRRETTGGLVGVRGIPTDRAFELLSAYLAADETHAVVLDVDWNASREHLAVCPPHLRAVLGVLPRAHGPERAEPAHDDLPTYLRNEVARLIGYSPEDIHLETGLNELGVDSLMAVRLRNRLKADWNLEAPIVKFMENPSIRALAESLQESSTTAVIEGVL
ncbi:MAG TPA: beta-ketoacyl reductase, partial [Candidatus Saccharimonadales bacterium]|nr:beta-ketoacyl reductase [Candidatus Saccharimonadales bacterium]